MADSRFYKEPDFDTLQVHAGWMTDPATNAIAVPIYQSAAYDFGPVDRAARLMRNEETAHIYSRVSNPTVGILEKRVAALEGGVAAVATSSGQAAQLLTVTTLAQAGDHVVSSARLYGGTYNQFKVTFGRFGITTTFVETTDPTAFAAAINDRTKLIFLEIIANSDGALYDIEAIAKIAHEAGIPLVVDNTVGMGGYLVRPISLGADIVVHSATKWLCGHGTTLAGIIIDSGNFDWRNSDKFPTVNGPSAAYGGANFAQIAHPSGFATIVRLEGLRDLGPCLSAQSAFSILQGIETLSLRAQRQCANALTYVGPIRTKLMAAVQRSDLYDHN
ncbi:hypothetical protein MKEN_00625900 [Mycena kentingensis (nom. inval.)]|nr:hypothetical protein MKEN_00625900 [Mycena kentingensis (nom. inval.)]